MNTSAKIEGQKLLRNGVFEEGIGYKRRIYWLAVSIDIGLSDDSVRIEPDSPTHARAFVNCISAVVLFFGADYAPLKLLRRTHSLGDNRYRAHSLAAGKE